MRYAEIFLLPEAKNRLLSLAKENPTADGLLWSDEVLINALVLGILPSDAGSRVAKEKVEFQRKNKLVRKREIYYTRTPLHRRASGGNSKLAICPGCGVIFNGMKKMQWHQKTCKGK